jgi:mono/diheme cytochrome c family protein
MMWLAFWIFPLMGMDNGEYLVRLGGCIHCHTERWDQPFAGGRRLVTPFGDFFTPNITPDRVTGIGSWAVEDFVRALDGMAPDGLPYYPAFPYRAFTNMIRQDRIDIFNFLKRSRPIRKARQPNEIGFPYNRRQLLAPWQLLYSWGGMMLPTRGAYLVEAVAHCTECHTPRDSLGGLKESLWMAGSNLEIGGLIVPNITPDPRTGLGEWSRQDWERFLASGIRPSGRSVGGEMAWVIFATSTLTPPDRAAVADYMMSLKPIYNRVGAE